MDYINPMIPYFEGAKQVAANVPQPGERGDYTAEMFQTDFPSVLAGLQGSRQRGGAIQASSAGIYAPDIY